MRKPTPVITMTMSALSGSRVMSTPMLRFPLPRSIQFHSVNVVDLSMSAAPAILASTMTPATKATRTTPGPTQLTKRRPRRTPAAPLITQPSSGIPSMTQVSAVAVVAPMPRASVRMATAMKLEFLDSIRTP